MDHVYAKLQRQRVAPYRRIMSNSALFDEADLGLSARAPYDPNTLLEDGEWFALQNFRDQDFSLDVLRDGLASTSVAELKKDEFRKISYVMSVQGGNFHFQRVRPAAFIRRRSIVFGDVALVEEPRNRIVLNERPDAVFVASENTLLFRDLVAISAIFKGIDVLYQEATSAEVETFLGQSFVASDLAVSGVSKPNRKRIALAAASLDQMTDDEKKEIFDYINEYGDGRLDYDEAAQTFLIQTDEELKMLLFGIEQRFYTTQVGAERRLANSVIKL